MNEVYKKVTKLNREKMNLLHDLFPVAKSAAAQMADAGMKNGVAPLNEILFQIEALDEEMQKIITDAPTEDKVEFMVQVLSDMKKG